MNPDQDYTRWNRDELKKAEATATEFLQENAAQISATLRAKMRLIDLMVQRLAAKATTLDQRLDCFARISEVAQLLREDADGFFELASQPVVAQTLLNCKPSK